MQPLDAVYLQILKNLCTDLSEPVPLDGVDPSALYRLAEKHCSLPFLLPYFDPPHMRATLRSFFEVSPSVLVGASKINPPGGVVRRSSPFGGNNFPSLSNL